MKKGVQRTAHTKVNTGKIQGGYKGAASRLNRINIDGNRIEPSNEKVKDDRRGATLKTRQQREGINLEQNGHFITEVEDKIDDLILDLVNYNSEVITDKSIEIEVRLLSPNTNKVADKFKRVKDWLIDKFKSAQIPITEISFQEIDYQVPLDKLPDKGHTVQFISRNGQVYTKVKRLFRGGPKDTGEFIILPNIIEIQPRLGVSLESNMKIIDLTSLGIEPIVRNRTRWTFPIGPEIYKRLILYENIGIDIRKVATQNVRGKIDITKSEKAGNPFIDYAVEIEIDDTNGKGEKILIEKITREQMDFLDAWIKILAIVINRSGSLMTTGESEMISSKLNSILGFTGVSIPIEIVNQPKDLQKHDLAWL